MMLTSRSRSLDVQVEDVRNYPTFEEMLRHEEPSHIVPGATGSQVLEILRDIYPAQRERLGVVVLQLRPENGTQGGPAVE